MIGSPRQHIDRLLHAYQPLHAMLMKPELARLPGGGELRALTPEKLLEADVREIGLFFAQADTIGARSEFALLAECIALLRSFPADAAEHQIDKAMKELRLAWEGYRGRNPLVSEPVLGTPLCWRTASLLAKLNFATVSHTEALKMALTDFAGLFMLHDGNITPEENTRFSHFKRLLEETDGH